MVSSKQRPPMSLGCSRASAPPRCAAAMRIANRKSQLPTASALFAALPTPSSLGDGQGGSQKPAEQDLAKGIGDLLARIRRSSTASDEKRRSFHPSNRENPWQKWRSPKARNKRRQLRPNLLVQRCSLKSGTLTGKKTALTGFVKSGKKTSGHRFDLWQFQELKKKSAKGEKLSETFYKTVIGPKLLCTSKRREDWVATQKHNRSLRYVPHPSSVDPKQEPLTGEPLQWDLYRTPAQPGLRRRSVE